MDSGDEVEIVEKEPSFIKCTKFYKHNQNRPMYQYGRVSRKQYRLLSLDQCFSHIFKNKQMVLIQRECSFFQNF